MRLLVICLFALSGCGFMGPTVPGSGTITKEVRQVGDFEKISFAGSGELTVLAGAETTSCEIECDDNLQEYIETKIEGGQLQIQPRNNVRLSPTKGFRIYVSTPTLKSLKLAGATTANLNGLNETGSLSLEAAGSHLVTCDGKVDKFTVDLAGSSKLHAKELIARDVDLEIAGAGSAEVHATENLKISVAGSGNVSYAGDPKVTQSIAGVGSVKKLQQ